MTDLIGVIWPYVAALVGSAAVVVGAYLTGRRDSKTKADAKRGKEYKETRERMDDEDYLDGDVGLAADRLRKRGER